jgi:DNA-binding transcriptional MerR regulator
MALAVIERKQTENFGGGPEAAALAEAFFRSVLYDLILCHDRLDAGVLRRWEFILRGGRVREYTITRYFQAIAEAKRRSRNPENIAAYLLYRLSHGTPREPTKGEGGRRCIACSAPVDEARRAAMVRRIREGFRLRDIRTVLDCEDFVGTHLTQEEMFEFVGHEVSFSYQEKKIEELYRERAQREREEVDHEGMGI